MGAGTNRFNIYTIRAMTQGLATYLLKQNKNNTVVIGFDNRNNSQLFATEAAKVLAANNIYVLLFKELRPSPLVSFTCRYKKCSAAIMITASHNPPEYNGFKVYWQDGAQVLPPHDKGIIEEVNKIIDPLNIASTDITSPLITIINDEMDTAYIKALDSLKITTQAHENKELKIIYTNLHGTGITLLPKALSLFGFTNISYVEEQKNIDGNFTNAPIPNPEDKKALQLGLDLLKNQNADILIATDPDADRIAIATNQYVFNGNQIACLLFQYVLKTSKRQPNDMIVKSIVTTPLLDEMAKQNNIACFNVLTGFKYIADIMEKNPSYHFLLGAEESYGYLVEDFVRDKDSISAALFLCNYAIIAKKKKKTLLDMLYEIYQQYGLYQEKLVSLKFDDTQEGYDKMNNIMTKLRNTTPQEINNLKVITIEDYEQKQKTNLVTHTKTSIDLPKANVLIFTLSDQSKIILRPSGTEPKMKIYISTMEKNFSSIDRGIKLCEERLNMLAHAVNAII
jgi:phosphoglucomutase/phosphomannomutase